MKLQTKATPPISYGGVTSRGSSETALFVEEAVDRGRHHLDESISLGLRASGVYEALYSVCEECGEPNWDGYGAETVSKETYQLAYRFLESLPLGTAPPSVGAEADGHVTFEWYRSPNRLLSVSISPDGMVYYAALLGASKRSGTEPFDGEVPEDIMIIVRRLSAP